MDSRLQAAREAGLRGQHQQAVDLCVAVLQEKPGDPMAVAFLGLSLWRAQAHAQAVDVLQQALRHWPAQDELNLALLDCWRALGQEDRALQHAAALPAELLAGPLFASWRAALQQGAAELGPGLAAEEGLTKMYDQGLLAQLEQELAPLLQAHLRWGRGAVLRALLTFSHRGRAVSADMLGVPEDASASEVESLWRDSLGKALSRHRDQVVALTLEALALSPDDARARLLLAHARFENGQSFGKDEIDAIAAQLKTPLLGPVALRSALDPVPVDVAAIDQLEAAGMQQIPAPRSDGAAFDLSGAIGPALTNARYLGVAPRAKVASGSDVVLLSDGSALCHPLTHALGELVHYASDSWIVLGGTQQLLLRDLPVIGVDGPAISLLGASSRHYGHWLLEHLPRLRSLARHPLAAQACLLVEADMPASHYEALQLLLGPDAEMRRIAPGHCIEVERLLFTGTDVFFPHLTRRDLPPTPSVAPASVDGLAWLREQMLAALGGAPRQGRRILVRRRGSGTRQLLNEDAVCELLVKHWGFEALYPETLGFADQVRRFHDADVIVGVQGSGLSNCVFCAPGARVIALCSGFAANFPSWAHALECMGLQHCFVVGAAQPGSHVLAIQCDFDVDLEALGQALTGLGVTP